LGYVDMNAQADPENAAEHACVRKQAAFRQSLSIAGQKKIGKEKIHGDQGVRRRRFGRGFRPLDIAAEKGESVAAEMAGNALFVQADATSEEEVQAALDKTAAAFGTLNVVVNCAGVADRGKILSRRGPLSLAAFRQVLSVNLVGTVNVVRLAVAQMVKNAPGPDGERGVIVNTASVAAFDGQIGQIAYAASKAGVVGLTLPLARECADYGIRAVTIAPGLFDTPLMAGLPEGVRIELAKTVPNGECIRLDGALRMTAR